MPSVLVAMSGGVDSSVAAAVLRDAGYDVVGVTLKLHDEVPQLACGSAKQGCCTAEDADDARAVAARLGIAYYVLDLSAHFAETVMQPFVAEYAAGRTPNPCVECNRHVKFTELARYADQMGIEFVATGHHARLDGGVLRRGADPAKDQSYVLACLDPAIVGRVLLPIGAMTKAEVRAAAAAAGLRTAQKAESMEVCFLGSGGKTPFLQRRLGDALVDGDVVDAESGAVVGRHGGAALFTVGQRKGLGVAVGTRAYVQSVDVTRNVVRIAPRPPVEAGFAGTGATWLDAGVTAGTTRDVAVQASAHGRARRAVLHVAAGDASSVTLVYDVAAPATAPGQLVALYATDADGGHVLGAATHAGPVEVAGADVVQDSSV